MTKKIWKNPIFWIKSWYDLVIWIPKTNTRRILVMLQTYSSGWVYLIERKQCSNKRTINEKDCKIHSKPIQNRVWQKTLVVLNHLCLKFGADIKEIGCLKEENILVDHESHQSIRTENPKQNTLKIEKIQQNKHSNIIFQLNLDLDFFTVYVIDFICLSWRKVLILFALWLDELSS